MGAVEIDVSLIRDGLKGADAIDVKWLSSPKKTIINFTIAGLADDVIVQWPQLKDTYPRVRTLDEMS